MNPYIDIQGSVRAWCKNLFPVFAAQNLGTFTRVYNFDAHADLNELPEEDLIGSMQYAVQTNGRLVSATMLIAVSTMNDTNLFRLDEIMALLYEKLKPESVVPLYSMKLNSLYGQLKVKDGTAVLPVTRARIRPVKAIAFELGSDHALTP